MPQVPVQLTAGETAVQGYNGACRLLWYSIKESTGSAPAEVDLYDGSGDSGPAVAFFPLGDGEALSGPTHHKGLHFSSGFYIAVPTGSAVGNFQIVVDEPWEEWDRPRVVINIPIDELAAAVESGMGTPGT